jgi:undecaprenyl-diphosphatase
MLEWLSELDKVLFILINIELANPVTDFIMPIITSDNVLRIGYVLVMLLLLWRGNARVRWMALFSALTILVSDQLSSQIIKNIIERPRPCHIMSDLNLLVNCGSGFSMPSSHAVNAFAQAAFFGALNKKSQSYLIIIASLIAVSRVFVGVHYPGDVFVGTILGSIVGLVAAAIFVQFSRKVITRAVPNRNSQE